MGTLAVVSELCFLQIVCIVCVKKRNWQAWQDGAEDEKALIAKAGDLSLSPWDHMVEGETQLPHPVL